MSATLQRVIAAVMLLAVGIVSLPLSAWAFFGGESDGWIIPAQVMVTVLAGSLLALGLRAMAPAGAAAGKRVLFGAGWGAGAA